MSSHVPQTGTQCVLSPGRQMNNCFPEEAVDKWECEGLGWEAHGTMTTSKPLRWVWAGSLHHPQRPSNPAPELSAGGGEIKVSLSLTEQSGQRGPPAHGGVGGGTTCFASGGVRCGTHLMTTGYITDDAPQRSASD